MFLQKLHLPMYRYCHMNILKLMSPVQILPIHCACINPNGDYLKALLNSVPEHSIPDKDGFKPMHYAAACEGPGPLKVLLARY